MDRKSAIWMMLVLTGLLLLVACQPGSGTAVPTSGIVFVTTRHVERSLGVHRNWELYLVQPDGSGLTRLTDNDRVDTSPSWSPDGRQIVFRSRIDGSSDIIIMDANGENWHNLIEDPEDSIFDEFYPEWNPQRDLIALYTDRSFSARAGCAWHRLAIMPVAGGAENIQMMDVLITEQETLGWAPDGRHLAFSSRCDLEREKGVEIFQWDIDSDELIQLTDDGFINASPAYSHNGRYLAYQSVQPNANADLMLLDLQTGETANLTNDPQFKDSHPTWSPDDSQIAFVSNRDGNDEIYVIDLVLQPFASGINPVNISNHSSKDFEPTWSPIP